MFLKKRPMHVSTTESDRAVQEAYDSTLDLRRTGITGYVLVSLSVRRDGTVESAVAIMPKLEGEFRVHAIDGKTGAELPPPPLHTLQPDLCRAAEKAALSQRFRAGDTAWTPRTLSRSPYRLLVRRACRGRRARMMYFDAAWLHDPAPCSRSAVAL